MDTVLEIEEHLLPPDTWGEAPQALIAIQDEAPPTTLAPTTVPPPMP